MLLVALLLIAIDPAETVRPVTVASVSLEILVAQVLDRPAEPAVGHLVIRAKGTVGREWTNPRLIVRGTGPGPDGFLEFDFVFDAGDNPSRCPERVEATMLATADMLRGSVKGFRVYGGGGSVAGCDFKGL